MKNIKNRPRFANITVKYRLSYYGPRSQCSLKIFYYEISSNVDSLTMVALSDWKCKSGICDTVKIVGLENAEVTPMDSQPENKKRQRWIKLYKLLDIFYIDNSLALFAFLVCYRDAWNTSADQLRERCLSVPFYVKIWRILTHPLSKSQFSIYFRS